MGSTALTTVPGSSSDPESYPLSIEQYHQMIEAGIFRSGDRVELLEGRLVKKVTRNPPHDSSLWRVEKELERILPPTWLVRIQSAITLSDSEPEPDVVVAVAPIGNYDGRHPGPKDIALIVEVADSTLAEDRNTRSRIYARARIPTYWIVNIPERKLEVHTRPQAGRTPRYREKVILSEDGTAFLSLDNETVGPLSVASMLPGGTHS